jgi:hypothetical protein
MSRIWVHVRPPAARSKIVMASLFVVWFCGESKAPSGLCQRDIPGTASRHGRPRQARGLDTRAHKHSASSFQGDQAKAIVEAKDAQNLSVRWVVGRCDACHVDGGDGSDDIIHPHQPFPRDPRLEPTSAKNRQPIMASAQCRVHCRRLAYHIGLAGPWVAEPHHHAAVPQGSR